MNTENVETLGYSAILLSDIQACSDAYGTENYGLMVERLRRDCLNLFEGPPIRSIIDDFYQGKWRQMIQDELQEWKRKNPDIDDLGIYQSEEEKIRDEYYVVLADFIKQTLMDHQCIKLFSQVGGK